MRLNGILLALAPALGAMPIVALACVPGAVLVAGGGGGSDGEVDSAGDDGNDDAGDADAMACDFDARPEAWTTLEPMSLPSYGLGAAFVDGKLYAIGGFNKEFNAPGVNRVAAYDPCNHSWEDKKPLPIASCILQYFGVATIGKEIYVVGGDDGCGHNVDTLYKYNTAFNAWSPLPPMPRKISGLGAGAIDGIVYAVGGIATDADGGGTPPLDTLYAYDTSLGQWSMRPSMPTARFHPTVAVIGGKLYVAAGNVPGPDASLGVIDVLEVYDPASDSWKPQAPMPYTKVGAGAAIGTQLYIPGGASGAGEPESLVVVYDSVNDKWSALADLPTPRHDMGVAADPVRKTLFAIGGYDGKPEHNDVGMTTNEAFTP